jgi:hypothetical protein
MGYPIVAGAAALGLSKRAENRRKQAAANQFSGKYPLLNDCPAMESSISTALGELKTIDATPAKTAAARRVKKRNSDTLRSWLLVMREHLKDLTCGINVASTSVAPVPAQAVSSAQISPILDMGQAVPTVAQEEVAQESVNLAAPTKKKGVNWILIGGVAVAGYFIYKFLKKK